MQRSANGVLVLVLGILAIMGFGCLTGIPAWIIGNQSLKAIDSGQADPSERGIVQVGRILGIVMTIAAFLVVVVWMVFLGGIVALGVAGSQANGPR